MENKKKREAGGKRGRSEERKKEARESPANPIQRVAQGLGGWLAVLSVPRHSSMYTVDSECELDSIRRDAAANAGTCEGSKARASAVGGVIGFSLQPLTYGGT